MFGHAVLRVAEGFPATLAMHLENGDWPSTFELLRYFYLVPFQGEIAISDRRDVTTLESGLPKNVLEARTQARP